MINALISKVFGTRSDREIKLLYPLVDEINVLSNNLKEKSIEVRERKASSGATVDGLKKRKNDLLDFLRPVGSLQRP